MRGTSHRRGASINCKYDGLFENWEIKHARELVWEFQEKFRVLKSEGREDLLQECLTHWYFKKCQFDSSKFIALKTYMSRVIENKLMDIIELKERQKRKIIYQSISLDELMSHINEEECSDHLIADDESFKAALTSDINLVLLKALEKLSHRQQELCRLLRDEGLNMKQVSEKLNIPRGTLFDEILRIREIFRNEGLMDYLP